MDFREKLKFSDNSRYFVLIFNFIFAKILLFREKIGIPNIFAKNVHENFRFRKHCRENICFPNIVMSCCPVPSVLSRILIQAVLSSPTCLGGLVSAVQSQMSCPNPFCHVSVAVSHPHLSRASFPVQAALPTQP